MIPARTLGVGGFGTLAVLVAQARRAATRGYLHNEPEHALRARATPDGAVVPTGHDATGRPAEPGTVRVVAVGDSTARGVGADDLGGATPVAVARIAAARVAVPVEVVGLGFSGARTADVLAQQVPRVAALHPDVVMVMAGANDVTHGTPPWRFARTTDALLAGLGAIVGPDRVVQVGIGRFCGVPALDRPLQDLVDRYGALLAGRQRASGARLGTRWVDIARDASPRFFGRRETLSADGFHPSGLGYRFWAEAIAPQVVAALAGVDDVGRG